MIIEYVKKTNKTASRLKELMPDELIDEDICLNLGNSNIDYTDDDYLIINEPDAIRNSANKKRMFELFKENNIRCVEYVDIREVNIFQRLLGKLYIRKGYATKRENKVSEFRIIVFNNRILKTYLKMPQNKNFVLKKNNCVFKRIREPFIRSVKDNILNSVKCLGLDLAGVDMLINTNNEDKIIEVNSGPGMGYPTIRKLYKRIRRMIE